MVEAEHGSSLFNLAELKREGFKAGDLLAVDPQLRDKLMTHLSRTVKRDEVAKNLILSAGVSAYTKNPINLFMRGPSSIGKSYNATEVLKYFPEEDIWYLGGLSPTALVHDYGILYDAKGEDIDLSEKPTRAKVKAELIEAFKDVEGVKIDKRMVDEEFEKAKKRWRERLRGARYIVDLRQKILCVLEPPHIETYNKLRPILSHDKEEISYKYTDKEAKGRLRTVHVVIKGWPSTIFCSTEELYIEDLATRGFTITPEMGPEKYRAGIEVIGEKKALPWKFHNDFDFMLLQGYFRRLKHRLESLNVAIPYARELGKYYPSTYARSMRDYDHVTALLEISALFYYAQRPVLVIKHKKPVLTGEPVIDEEHVVLATMRDLEFVLGLWRYAEETTVTGLPGHILEFYHKAVEPLAQQMSSFTYQDLTQKYNEVSEHKKSSWTIRKWVKLLTDVGYLDTDPDPADKRRVMVKVIKKVENVCNYWIPRFLGSFKLESFKKWLDDVKKILETESILFKENLIGEPSPIDTIYEEYFVSNIFPKASDSEIDPKQGKNREIIGFQESQRILRLSLSDLVSLLRAEFMKGTQEEFQALVKQRSVFNSTEAESLFKRLVDEGQLAMDPEGFWRWI